MSSSGTAGSGGSRGHDMQIKLLTIGNSGVGKTCLLLRYGQNQFSPTFITTIGIDFKVKYVNIDGKRIKLQIWDTAGQERFRTITTSYFKGAQGILLVYDITDRDSFENVDTWITEIHRNADKQVSKVLVGNKADMEKDRVVTEEEGRKLAERFGVPFFEASAKDDKNVTEVFEHLAKLAKDRLEKTGAAMQSGQGRVDVRQKEDQKKSGCCK
eukprot:gb/GECG01004715.1/.p1 GENE.gb/GECG01004715.1/~~gb/GECG01004715.1/.p1  ORF type:complete len:213 (+),score=32.83 gb/GECG01004715.1/:1-639(+)